jgi:glycine hydroxymethyltransferase
MTTRGFGVDEATQVAHLMADVLEAPQDEPVIARVALEVQRLCARLPVYG